MWIENQDKRPDLVWRSAGAALLGASVTFLESAADVDGAVGKASAAASAR